MIRTYRDTISTKSRYSSHNPGHTQAAMTAPNNRSHRTSRPQRDPGPPPGRAQPARSRSEPPVVPQGCNLAPAAKRGNRATCERPARSLCARARAAAGRQRAPRMPPTLVRALAPSPAHITRARRPLRAVTGPPGRPQPSRGGPLGARWRRRVGINPCRGEASRGVSVEGYVGARLACHGGGCGALWRRLGPVSVRAWAARSQHAHLAGGSSDCPWRGQWRRWRRRRRGRGGRPSSRGRWRRSSAA